MALTASGIGSGLDVDGLVTQLVAAERVPLERRLIKRESNLTQDISALGTFKSALSDLQSSLSAVNSPATFQQKNGLTSDSTVMTVSAGVDAATGSYAISVENLAAAQSLALRATFGSLGEVVGTGTLTFTRGTTAYTADTSDPVNTANDTYDGFVAKAGAASSTVTIDSTNSTLSGVRDAINAADIGITASIVNDGSAYRLVLSSSETGAENSFQVVVSDAGDSNDSDGSGLSRLAFNSAAGTTNVYQTVAAVDAGFSVNGLALTSTSNLVTDAITGVNLTLKKTSTTPVAIDITDNTSGIKSAINTFVAGYNDYIATVKKLTAYDASTGASGALQGDFSARSISDQVRNTISAISAGWDGTYTRLAEIGITSTSTGELAVDDTKLSAALTASISGVEGVLTRFAAPSSGSGISVASLTDTAVKGSYAVAVSSLATNGTLSATVPGEGFPITIDSSTDSFVVTVDGTTSGTITLTSQAYANLSAIATEIQAKINADATLRAAGKAVTVSVSGNDIEFRSSTLGSSSSVALANAGTDTTIAALGLALATTTNGTDLVGTIDGVAGVATGNRLTGAASSAANGLSLDITTTTGGIITVSDGVIDQLDTLLSSLLGTESPLDSRITGLTSQVDSIAEDRALLERRLQVIEKRYRSQFSALDMLLSQLNSTSSFLTTQLQNLPGSGGMNKK